MRSKLCPVDSKLKIIIFKIIGKYIKKPTFDKINIFVLLPIQKYIEWESFILLHSDIL